jgi:hypothetical protein
MRFVKVAVLVLFATVPMLAVAGAKVNAPVVINDDMNMASGSLQSARESADSVQLIFCEILQPNLGQCRARNSAGVTRSCYFDSRYFQLVTMINSSSFVTFWWDEENHAVCNGLTVRNGSNYLP